MKIIANNGKEFDNVEDCLLYEQDLERKKNGFLKLKESYIGFNFVDDEIDVTSVEDGAYLYIKKCVDIDGVRNYLDQEEGIYIDGIEGAGLYHYDGDNDKWVSVEQIIDDLAKEIEYNKSVLIAIMKHVALKECEI